jgi:hypothetical protein
VTNWKLTDGLTNLLRQINAWAPNRDHASDGTIGDKAHQAEVSGHNPDDSVGAVAEWNGDPDDIPEVRALDIDTDFRNGFTAQQVVDHLRALPGLASAVRYMIYNRKMYHEKDGFEPTPYTGASAHTEHIHFSGAWTQAGDEDTTFNYRLGDLAVALEQTDIDKVTASVIAALTKTTPLSGADGKSDGTNSTPIGNAVWAQGIPPKTGAARVSAWKSLASVGDALSVATEGADPAAIAAALIEAGIGTDVAGAIIAQLNGQ